MKTKNLINSILTIGIILLINKSTAYAQSGSNWMQNGTLNSCAIGTNYLGTAAGTGLATDLDFWTASAETMILTTAGNLNVTGAANGYQIDANYVLWNNGDNTSLFTGISAGNASITGTENTLTGYSTGNSLTAGSYNTFTGDYAGNALFDGKYDSYYGVNAEITD